MLRHWMGRSLAAAWNTRAAGRSRCCPAIVRCRKCFFCVIVQRRWFLDRKFIFLPEQADGLLRSGSSHAIGNPYPTVRSRLRIA